MQIKLISTRIYLINFINKFIKDNGLIFFNIGEPNISNNFGEKIDVDIYKSGILNIKIGTKEAYEKSISPNLVNKIYRENQLDFISIIQIDGGDIVLGALVTVEPNRSPIAKVLVRLLKKEIKRYYNIGMLSAEDGFENFNKSFSKYYWSNDILDKTDIYDWDGGKPRLLPVLE